MLYSCSNRKELLSVLEAVQPGDCLQIPGFSAAASSVKELLSLAETLSAKGAELVSLEEAVDTRTGSGPSFFSLCRALLALEREGQEKKRRDGINKAKEAGKYKGRKPIAVDEDLFESVVELWQSGQISARQAMTRMDLKPNTFYRRIKEREEQKMKDYKKMEKEIRSEIKEAAKQGRQELGELKKQVRAEAKELKQAADEKLELHDVEREMRLDRLQAKHEHRDAVRQLHKEVEAETAELKKVIEEQQ